MAEPENKSQPPIATRRVRDDAKTFFVDLKENQRGKLVKFTEENRGHRNTIIIGTHKLREVITALTEIAEEAEK